MSSRKGSAGGGGNSIVVAIRIRPRNSKERDLDAEEMWESEDGKALKDKKELKTYNFDRVFDNTSTNVEVYDFVAADITQKAVQGFNGTVFAYGQTGSGKTWSMMGIPEDPGIIRRSIRTVFDTLQAMTDCAVLLRASYLEVYNEMINDLLAEGADHVGKNLRILLDDPVKGAVIKDLTEEIVSSKDQLLGVITRGESRRHYGSTDMNANSSRSHTIYRLIIEIKSGAAGGSSASKDNTATSYLNLVDLAGSERASGTGAEGAQLKEGANINKSLLTLGVCISKLGEQFAGGKKNNKCFIPFRDSKMTRILKNSLGGNTCTSIILALGPARSYKDESLSTIKFGQVCKTIKNKAKVNEVKDEKTLLAQYKSRIQELTNLLEAAKVSSVETPQAAPADNSDSAAAGVLVEKEREEKQKLAEQVERLQHLVMSAGAPQPPAAKAGANLHRRSIHVCVSSSVAINSFTGTNELFNVVEDAEEDEDADTVQALPSGRKGTYINTEQSWEVERKRPVRRSVVGGAGWAGMNAAGPPAAVPVSGDVEKELDSLRTEVADLKQQMETQRQKAESEMEAMMPVSEYKAEFAEIEQILADEAKHSKEMEQQRDQSTLAHTAELARVQGELAAAQAEMATAQSDIAGLKLKIPDIPSVGGAISMFERKPSLPVAPERSRVYGAKAKDPTADLKEEFEAFKISAAQNMNEAEAKLVEISAVAKATEVQVATATAQSAAKEDALEHQLDASKMLSSSLEARVTELEDYYKDIEQQYSAYHTQHEEIGQLQAQVQKRDAEVEQLNSTLKKYQLMVKEMSEQKQTVPVEAAEQQPWSQRSQEFRALLNSKAPELNAASPDLSGLLQNWEDRVNQRFSELVAMEIASPPASPQPRRKSSNTAPPAPAPSSGFAGVNIMNLVDEIESVS